MSEQWRDVAFAVVIAACTAAFFAFVLLGAVAE